MLLAVAALTLAAAAGVVLAALDRPGRVRPVVIERVSLGLVVAVAVTVLAGVMSALLT